MKIVGLARFRFGARRSGRREDLELSLECLARGQRNLEEKFHKSPFATQLSTLNAPFIAYNALPAIRSVILILPL